jgi:hypothetical protein
MVMMTKAELGCEMSKLSFTLQPKGREAEEAKSAAAKQRSDRRVSTLHVAMRVTSARLVSRSNVVGQRFSLVGATKRET